MAKNKDTKNGGVGLTFALVSVKRKSDLCMWKSSCSNFDDN